MSKPEPKNPKEEALLELGRNMAIAIAIASAGYFASYTPQLENTFPSMRFAEIAAFALAGPWIGVSASRFVSVYQQDAERSRPLLMGIVWVAISILGIVALSFSLNLTRNAVTASACERVLASSHPEYAAMRDSKRCAKFFEEQRRIDAKVLMEN